MTDQTRTCYRTIRDWRTERARRYPAEDRITRGPRPSAGIQSALRTHCPRPSRLVGHLLGEVGPPLDLLLDPRVVQVELLGVGHSAHLELDARTQRAFLRPLLGLFLRRHVEDPKPVEQFLGLGVRAVGDDRRIRVEIDDEALVGSGQTLAGQHDAGLDELLVVAAHRFDDLVEVDVLLRHRLLGLGGRPHDQHVARHCSVSF